MIKNTVQCEMCGTEAHGEFVRTDEAQAYPEDWLGVRHGLNGHDPEPLRTEKRIDGRTTFTQWRRMDGLPAWFCGWACLIKHGERQVALEQEARDSLTV